MSQYKCKLFPLNKLPVGPEGVVEPLCNSCSTKDCSNPIELMQISIFGVQKEWKVYKKQSTASAVLHCVGYSKS